MQIEEYDKYQYSSTGKCIEKGKFEPSTFFFFLLRRIRCALLARRTLVSRGLGILPEDELTFRRTQKKIFIIVFAGTACEISQFAIRQRVCAPDSWYTYIMLAGI